MATETNTQIAPTTTRTKLEHIRGLLEKSQLAFSKVASKYMKPERLIKIALAAFSRQPELLECTPQSLLLALMQSVELGLEPNSAKKEAYLLPFWNNNGARRQREVIFLPSYTGLASVARRSGEVVDIEARVVYERDTFEVDYGEDKLTHKPYMGEEEPGAVIAAWARARFKDGARKFEVMPRREIDKIRASSKAANADAWTTWYSEMAKKSAVRRICKLLPKSDELATALAIESGDDNPSERFAGLIDFTNNVIELNAAPSAGGGTADAKKALRDKKEKAAPTAAATAPTADVKPAGGSGEVTADEAAEIKARERAEAERE